MNRLKKNKTPETTKIQTAPTDEGGANGIDPLAIQESKKIDEYRARASAGDAEAQNRLGYFYYHGVGIAEDKAEAAKWFRKSAEQGYLKGQKNLALCYSDGTGVEPDAEESIKWLTAAAEQGDLDSQRLLAKCHGRCNERDFNGWIEYMALSPDLFKIVKKDFAKELIDEPFDPLSVQGAKTFDECLAQANAGDAESQNCLGYLYYKGIGVAEDRTEAAKWFRKSAEQGYLMAQKNMVMCYLHGAGVQENLEEAFKWLTSAAEQGDMESQFNVARIYWIHGHDDLDSYIENMEFDTEFQEISKEDFEKKLMKRYPDPLKEDESDDEVEDFDEGKKTELNRGILPGNDKTEMLSEEDLSEMDKDEKDSTSDLDLKKVLAAMGLKESIPSSWELEREKKRELKEKKCAEIAVSWFIRAAEQGNLEARYRLARHYLFTKCPDKDVEKGMGMLLELAEQGYVLAQRELARQYEDGKNVPKDLDKAEEWFYRAAVESNAPEYQYAYGRFKLFRDEKIHFKAGMREGLKWMKMAAENGSTGAMEDLATLYDNGFCVECNRVEYAKYCKMAAEAAEHGYTEYQFAIGQCYRLGDGVPKDVNQAAYWYRKAAEQNDRDAQFHFGMCYYNAAGVERDLNKAIYWFVQAADKGMRDALYHLGTFYMYGIGTEENLALALILLRMASQMGVGPAFELYSCCKLLYERAIGKPRQFRKNCKHKN